MQRKAQHYGCITSYDEADQLLLISHKGVHLTAINPEGFMFYNSKDLTDPESREVFSHLTDDAETVREYVGLYESAPQMKPKDVQNYRKLSEYGDIVFAGMYSQKHGFMFCSWRQSDGGRYLAHGDYSPDYLSSKENFAVRAGLVDDNKLFTKEEAEELSFEAQVAAYTDKIMSNPEWSLVGIFADEGISGTQADKRKDFMRMIRMCRKGKIDQIITKSVSRFARNTVDCLNYVRELKQLGIPVIFEKEGLNTMHMTSEIYISMHGIFAQSESESLSGNVKWGKQKSAEKGNVAISYKNFLGYRKGADGKPEIVPEEAETVVMIYDWFLEGDSIRTIKYKLEAAGRLSPTGKTRWSESTIRSILTNEKYKVYFVKECFIPHTMPCYLQ